MQLRLILFLFLLISCKEKQELIITKSNESIVIYNQETYYKLNEKDSDIKMKIIDTSCINQTERAKKDIANDKLYYFYSTPWFEAKEMNELLKEYNIESKYYSTTCFGPPDGFENDCYKKLMWSEIDSKIGVKTIDSLWKIAERNFVIKYPDSVYIKNGIDIRQKHLSN